MYRMHRLHICHSTIYTYSNAVDLQPHFLRMRPREGHDIRIESSRLDITPAYVIKWHRDAYDNSVAVVSFVEPTMQLSIVSRVLIQHYEDQPLDFIVAEEAVNFPFHYDPVERIDLMPYTMSLFPADCALLRDWVGQFWQPGQVVETYVLLDRINKAIMQNFTYTMREEPGVQPPATTLAQHSGSCRDFAALFIEVCRYLGLAARFVSGYLHCPATEAGQGSTHAWAEVYLPGAGWKGFDATSGEVVGSHHIATAVHRHPEAVPPIAGSFIGQLKQPPTMRVEVQVVKASAIAHGC
jgi:transglutaminase-like putative cysteine protease